MPTNDHPDSSPEDGREDGPEDGPEDGFVEFARTRDPLLRTTLIESHLRIAAYLARRYTDRGEPYEDLFQVASVALIGAVDRYEPDRGVSFATFATQTILGELKRHFRDRGWAVKAPRRIQELYLALNHAVSTLSQQLGRAPTVTELAREVGASEDDVLEAMEAARGYRSSSIDSASSTGEAVADQLGDEDRAFDQLEQELTIASLLDGLSERARLIIHLRFYEGLTQSEIATRLGLSQMQISRLLTQALSELRSQAVTPGR